MVVDYVGGWEWHVREELVVRLEWLGLKYRKVEGSQSNDAVGRGQQAAEVRRGSLHSHQNASEDRCKSL